MENIKVIQKAMLKLDLSSDLEKIIDKWLSENKEEFQNFLFSELVYYKIRKIITKDYLWYLPSKNNIKTLYHAIKDEAVLDIGCGSGYTSELLAKYALEEKKKVKKYFGVNNGTYTCDTMCNTDEVNNIMTLDSKDTLEFVRSVPWTWLLSWPPYEDDFAYDILKEWITSSSTTLIYIGEEDGGCTANYKFFNELKNLSNISIEELDWERYPMIYDKILVFRKTI